MCIALLISICRKKTQYYNAKIYTNKHILLRISFFFFHTHITQTQTFRLYQTTKYLHTSTLTDTHTYAHAGTCKTHNNTHTLPPSLSPTHTAIQSKIDQILSDTSSPAYCRLIRTKYISRTVPRWSCPACVDASLPWNWGSCNACGNDTLANSSTRFSSHLPSCQLNTLGAFSLDQ